MERVEIDERAASAYSYVMSGLRNLPWQVREEVCAKLLYNPDFCWHCGMEKKPLGATCHCTNDA